MVKLTNQCSRKSLMTNLGTFSYILAIEGKETEEQILWVKIILFIIITRMGNGWKLFSVHL